DVDRKLAVLLLSPAAAAVAARLLDHLAGALTGRAGALDREEALLRTHAAVAAAGGADHGGGTALGAAAVAAVAAHRRRNPDRRLLAGERLLERDLHVVAEVGAPRPAAARPAAPSHHVAEHLVEDVGEAGAEVEVEAAGAGPRADPGLE